MAKQTSQRLNMYERIINDITLYKTKLANEMAELKLAAILFGLFFYPAYIWTVFDNFGDFKSLIVLLFTLIIGGWRFNRWLKKDKLLCERIKIENQMEQLKVREKEIEMRERELTIMEREKKIRV